MPYYNQSINIQAETDLRAFEFRALAIDGTLATGTPQARGISSFKVDSGEQATLVFAGRSRYQSGGAIGAYEPINVSSGGFMIAATSGDHSVGFNESAAVTSGSFADGVFNFLSRTLTTSEG